MHNIQPFFHRATVLFTATREIGSEELMHLLRLRFAGLYPKEILVKSIYVEDCDAEPGDPLDLI